MTNRNVNPNLRKNIVKLRKNAGYRSALKFSEAVEIPHATIRDIEAGYSNGTFETKKKIAEFFGITEADLLSDPEKTDSTSALDQAVTLTQAQLKALADEAAKNGSQAVLDAINRPTVPIYDDSARGKLHKFIEGLSDSEAKYLHMRAQAYVDEARNLVSKKYTQYKDKKSK